jgi:hypothetical protein
MGTFSTVARLEKSLGYIEEDLETSETNKEDQEGQHKIVIKYSVIKYSVIKYSAIFAEYGGALEQLREAMPSGLKKPMKAHVKRKIAALEAGWKDAFSKYDVEL